MDAGWVTEGETTTCGKHGQSFPRSHVCPACLADPAKPVEVDTAADEAKYTARVAASADRLHAQADESRGVVSSLLGAITDLRADLEVVRKGDRAEQLAAALASAVRAWAMAADVERKAIVAAGDYDKVLARVAKVAAMRSERTKMRKGRGH